MKELRIVISGGGTGGHIFPAVSIANAIRELRPDAKILFVGANGRMEMQRVPQAGYEIVATSFLFWGWMSSSSPVSSAVARKTPGRSPQTFRCDSRKTAQEENGS